MKRTTRSYPFCNRRWALATVAAIWLAFTPAVAVYAQLGSDWLQITPTKAIQIDGDTGDSGSSAWAPYQSNCSPTICANYTSTSNSMWGDGTETFRIFDGRSNRSEIRVYNDHTSGAHQFEGYVTIYYPLEDESLFQIKFSPNSHPEGSTQLMLRGFQANGGEIRKYSSNVLASGVYGTEKRINVIHLEEDVGGKIMTYIDGALVDEFTDTEIGFESAFKYGVYGTTSGNVPAIAEWRNVRVFRDGLPPSAIVTPPGAYEAENAILNGPIFASNQSGYTGYGFADYVNPSGDFVEWQVSAASAGPYDLQLRYALESGDRPLKIVVNGETVAASLSFPVTGDWETWAYATIPSQFLQAGANTIRATAIGSSGPNIDHLLLSPGLLGDLDGDDDVDFVDFSVYNAHLFSDLSALSAQEAYLFGDLDSDGDNDRFDFLLFKNAYEAANGAGSFSQMLTGVPEPAAGPLLLLGTLLLLSRRESGFAHASRRGHVG